MATEKAVQKVSLGTHKKASTLVMPAGYKLTEASATAVAALTRQYVTPWWSNPDKTHSIAFLGITELLEDILGDVLPLVKIEKVKAKAKKKAAAAAVVETGDEEDWSIE